MKIGKIELTQEKLIITVSAAVLIVVFAVYFVFYAPLMRKLRTDYLECRELENKALKYRNVIRSAGEIYGERTLLTERDISQAIDELAQYGRWKGVNFVSMNPYKIEEDKVSQYKILPVKMQIESSYQQLGIFLGSLDDLEKSLIKVKSFNIVPGKEDLDKVVADLVIDMYFSGNENAE
ncbi:MAG: type 4a pilus biogenesis protein PilO [Candidatus Omnitrophota bacterium]|nr:MAG: type 4a pilus biogenesis protein PilO [Candidatus Omnitrophota bacterium]